MLQAASLMPRTARTQFEEENVNGMNSPPVICGFYDGNYQTHVTLPNMWSTPDNLGNHPVFIGIIKPVGDCMKITWYGHSCFKLEERDQATVVTDPYDAGSIGYAPLSLSADIVTISHDSPGHNHLKVVHGTPFKINGPGEYEIGKVFITGVQTNQKNRSKEHTRNILYVFDYDGLTVAHLGNINRIPDQAEIEALGRVHIALVPVGGGTSLNASKASEVISLLEPNLVIPMHYGTPACKISLQPIQKFLKEMGLSKVETTSYFKTKKKPNLLPKETHVVVLDYSMKND